MYKWLKAYADTFDKEFPFMEVKEYTEYEICRIIQYCVETQTEYTAEVIEKALVGTAKVGDATI